jgi:hypothetical protein
MREESGAITSTTATIRMPSGVDPDLVPSPGPKQRPPHGRPCRPSAAPGIGVAAPHDRVSSFPAIGVAEANSGAPLDHPVGPLVDGGLVGGKLIRHRSDQITHASDCSRPV